jgi:tetratricopeptide (TPR) repeat protein
MKSDNLLIACDNAVPFAQSKLWINQRNCYQKENVNLWHENKLPYYATSNPYIADTYAHIVIRYMQDIQRSSSYNAAEPFYIIELGAGAGAFSFYMLKALTQLRQELQLESIKFIYVMTELTAESVECWQAHPNLQPYLAVDCLDFALYDTEAKPAIKLIRADKILDETQLHNPLLVIANYFFDSLRHDFFQVTDGVLQIGMLNAALQNLGEVAENTPLALTALDPEFHYTAVKLPFYHNKAIDSALRICQRDYNNAQFNFPIGAMMCIEQLRKLAGNHLLLLVSDKAYGETHIHQAGALPPEIVAHGQIFSMVINFPALQRYTQYYKGDYYTETICQQLSSALFVIGNTRADLPETFQTAAAYFGRCSTGNILALGHIVSRQPSCTLNTLVAWLSSTCWDNQFFNECLPVIKELLPHSSSFALQNLLSNLEKIADNFYYLPEASDTYFNIAVLLEDIGQYKSALWYYQQSGHYFGCSAQHLCHIAICHYHLGDKQQAVDLLEQAVCRDSNHMLALSWLGYLSKML